MLSVGNFIFKDMYHLTGFAISFLVIVESINLMKRKVKRMKLTINNLEQCFEGAVRNNAKYIGVKVQMQGYESYEVIINPAKNFETKSEYYKKAYNEDLSLKSFNGIKIVGFTYGNSYSEIQNDLEKY